MLVNKIQFSVVGNAGYLYLEHSKLDAGYEGCPGVLDPGYEGCLEVSRAL